MNLRMIRLVRENPERYLSVPSLHNLKSFAAGYEWFSRRNDFLHQDFYRWLASRHGVPDRWASTGIIRLVTPQDRDEFSFYFSELDAFLTIEAHLKKETSPKKPASLFLNLKKGIFSKPGMYLGDKRLSSLWCWISGINLAHRLERTGIRWDMAPFERWLQRQYGYKARYRWDRMILADVPYEEMPWNSSSSGTVNLKGRRRSEL
jgi:hypothetical protein